MATQPFMEAPNLLPGVPFNGEAAARAAKIKCARSLARVNDFIFQTIGNSGLGEQNSVACSLMRKELDGSGMAATVGGLSTHFDPCVAKWFCLLPLHWARPWAFTRACTLRMLIEK